MTSPVFSSLLNLDALVERATTSYTSTGESVRTWSDVATIKARLDRSRYSGSTAAFAEQGIIDVPSHKLFCEYEANILTGDRVTIGTEKFDVLEAFSPGGITHHKEVYLRRGGDV